LTLVLLVLFIGIALLILGIVWPFYFWWIPFFQPIIIWLGFLALLSPGKFVPVNAKWNKWARSGFLVYVILIVTFVFGVPRVVNSVCLREFGYIHYIIFGQIFPWLIAPFTSICRLIFPYQQSYVNDAIHFKPNIIMIRAGGFMSIIDISIYMAAGILIGRWREKRNRNRKTNLKDKKKEHGHTPNNKTEK
jgi:hypothetical protein